MSEWQRSLQQLCNHCINKDKNLDECKETKKNFKKEQCCLYYKCSIKNDRLAFSIQTEMFIGKFLNIKKRHLEEGDRE